MALCDNGLLLLLTLLQQMLEPLSLIVHDAPPPVGVVAVDDTAAAGGVIEGRYLLTADRTTAAQEPKRGFGPSNVPGSDSADQRPVCPGRNSTNPASAPVS